MREGVNNILYVRRGGCTWRMLPHEFQPWGTVHYFYRWIRLDGTWEKVHDRLRERVRREAGKKPTPLAGVIDSQSVEATEIDGAGATTPARMSRAGSDICASTHSA